MCINYPPCCTLARCVESLSVKHLRTCIYESFTVKYNILCRLHSTGTNGLHVCRVWVWKCRIHVHTCMCTRYKYTRSLVNPSIFFHIAHARSCIWKNTGTRLVHTVPHSVPHFFPVLVSRKTRWPVSVTGWEEQNSSTTGSSTV